MLATDAGDDVGWERWLTARTRSAAGPRARFFPPFGEVPLEFVGADQPRAPLGLDGCNRRDDAPVEGGEADAEHMCGLLARVHQPIDSSELAVIRP